ncbi:MAG: hypothetical protein IK083_03160 [Abditibacteriota bacterium]|nr:hypothetical protein [Abditibacteriota bacterium]
MLEDPAFSSAEKAAAEALREAFSGCYAIAVTDYDGLSSIDADEADALLIPNGRRLPAAAAGAIESYAKKGGDIVALAAPLWQEPLLRTDSGYTTEADYRSSILDAEADTVIFDGADLEGWSRGHSELEGEARHAISEYRGRRCMDVTLAGLHNYDTYAKAFDRPFTHGENVLEIVACGAGGTDQLVIECDERDGSRWMAAVSLSEDWQRLYLQPSLFRRWSGGENRGFPGDALRLSEISSVSVGIALTHVPTLGEGPQHYRVAMIGASREAPRHTPLLDTAELPDLDALSPSWKVYDTRAARSIRTNPAQSVVSGGSLPMPSSVSCLNPRQQSGGYDKGRDWRYIGLLEAFGAKGEYRGTAAALKIHSSGPFAGAVFASFAPADPGWYVREPVKRVLRETAAAMARGVFFLDAGSDCYTYFPDMQPLGGARIINVSPAPREAVCRLSAGGREVFSEKVTALPGECADISRPLQVPREGETGVEVTLSLDGEVIDRLENAIHFQTKTSRDFVTIEGGHFMLGGKVWKPWGVNYMPSSGAGSESAYFNNYLADYSYDPAVVERDFRKLREIGFNSINIFVFTGYAGDMNLLDMMRLADKYGLKINLSLRPGDPFGNVAESAEEIISLLRLADNDSVYAYDIAWEPSWGDRQSREWFDGAWEEWVAEQYGSVEAAEALWGCSIPRKETGEVTNPSGKALFSTGEEAKMAGAYRRFLDWFLYSRYRAAVDRIHRLDGHHFVSFRMSETSNPVNANPARIDYDFNYLSSAIDFWAPEGYGRIGNRERVRPLWFQREYAAFVRGDFPIIWPEVGKTLWDNVRMQVSPRKDRETAQHYANFFDALTDSGSDGVYMWVSCPGYRVDERSDYGIWNEDYTDREVTRVIKRYTRRFLSAAFPERDTPVKILTDTLPGGIYGIYRQAGEEFYRVLESGRRPYLVSEVTGLTTADFLPLTLEGRRPDPLRPAPLRHIDGAFESVTAEGHRLTVTCRNLNEAVWKAEGSGRVTVAASCGGETLFFPLPQDMKRGDACSLTIDLPEDWTGCELSFRLRGISFGKRHAVSL